MSREQFIIDSAACIEDDIVQLKAEIDRLKHELSQTNETCAALREGKPLGPVIGAQTILNQAREIDDLRVKLQHTRCSLKEEYGIAEYLCQHAVYGEEGTYTLPNGITLDCLTGPSHSQLKAGLEQVKRHYGEMALENAQLKRFILEERSRLGSGSLAMGEFDERAFAEGLSVWKWPSVGREKETPGKDRDESPIATCDSDYTRGVSMLSADARGDAGSGSATHGATGPHRNCGHGSRRLDEPHAGMRAIKKETS